MKNLWLVLLLGVLFVGYKSCDGSWREWAGPVADEEGGEDRAVQAGGGVFREYQKMPDTIMEHNQGAAAGSAAQNTGKGLQRALRGPKTE